MLTTCALLLTLTAGPEKPRLAVLDLEPGAGVTQAEAAALTEALVAQVSAQGFFSVISSADIRALLGQERQKQLIGCSDESTSCAAELAGALGAPFMLRGTVARLGDSYQLTLQTLDAAKAQPVSRSVRLAKDLGELRNTLPWSSAEATATPVPPPPSRALPVTLLVSGGVALLGAGVLGLDGLSRDQLLAEDLASGTQPGRLKTIEAYENDRRFIGTERSIALGLALGGAALATAGIITLILKKDPGPVISVLPTGQGVVFAGAF